MKTLVRHFALFALISLILSPLAISHASPPFDYEQWKRDHPLPAAKLTRGASSEYIVQIIYFVPNDRTPQGDIDTQLDALIKRVQQFYADEMERHGFGRKTFRLETDAAGKAIVHHVKGKFANAHYLRDAIFKADEEVREQFSKSENIIYLIWIDIDDPELGAPSQVGGKGGGNSHGGTAWIPVRNFDRAPPLLYIRAWATIAHELGHAFGLPHDYRDERYMLSYGDFVLKDQLSQSAAEWLDAHRYFNNSQTSTNRSPTIRMLSLSLASAPNAIRLRFSVTDPDGLHQARLVTNSIDGGKEEKGNKVLDSKSLNGESNATEIEFVTTELAARSDYVGLFVIDVHGNFTRQEFPIDVTSLRPSSEVVSIPDAELAASIRENLNLASGAAITKLDMLDLTTLKAAQSQIADLTGLEHATNLKYANLNWNQISDLTPLARLTRLRSLLIVRNQISNLAPLADLTQLSECWIEGNQISDITPLAGLMRLSYLLIRDNRISDIRPLAGLTKLRGLILSSNQISDITPLAGLTLLGDLFLHRNRISDVSSLAGLVNLQWLRLAGNPIADTSPLHELLRRNPHLIIDIDIGEPPPLLHSMAKVSGDGQEGLAGLALAAPFVISVLDEDGDAIIGAVVTFSVTAGEGILSATTATTDANGQAATTLTLILGSDTETNTVAATVEGLEPETFTATAVGQATPYRLAKVSGDGQQGTIDEALAEPFVVSVSDEDGKAIAGVVVTFSVTAGGGILSATTATTDANGHAAATLTLGSDLGTNTVEAIVAELDTVVTFTATGQEPPASLLDLFGAGGKLVALPDRPQLAQNAPNPFNSQTVLSYFLPELGLTRLEVFALTGQRVAVLHQGPQQAGYHRLRWNGRDDAGRPVASGIYLYRLVTDETVLTRKLILLR